MRWDVTFKALNGPLANAGPLVGKGNDFAVGTNPGAKGMRIPGARGIEAVHARISSHGGEVTITPVGTAQVRVAPYAGVDFAALGVIPGPVRVSRNNAIHLGRPGAGVTLELVDCRALGGGIEKGPIQSTHVKGSRRVPILAAGGLVGCLALVAVAAVTTAAVLWFVQPPDVEILVKKEGELRYDWVDLDETPRVSEALRNDLDAAVWTFVVGPSAVAAGRSDELRDHPELWDRPLLDRVAASMVQHANQPFFRRLDAIADEWGYVVGELRSADLPDVFAAIPYRESTYKPKLGSRACAMGWWQFMPETALFAGTEGGLTFRVSGCTFKDDPTANWRPTSKAPPVNVTNAVYIAGGQCRIQTCAEDDRTNLERSTAAAIFTLGRAWTDDTLRGSGSLVQAVITSHHAGYDDGSIDPAFRKPYNVLPALQKWKKDEKIDGVGFLGDVIRCPPTAAQCDSPLVPGSQHYAYPVVAQHLLAVCYYSKSYPEVPAFEEWARWKTGYCARIAIPERSGT